MQKKNKVFHLYRYHILPLQNPYQPELSKKALETEELIKKKNEIFFNEFSSLRKFRHHRAELTHKLFSIENYIVIKLGANRSLIQTTKEFVEKEIDNWPYVYIYLNNNPNIQIAAIEINPKVFYRTSTVSNIIENNSNRVLKKFGLFVQFLPMFEKYDFWRIVTNQSGKITSIRFKMVAPNLANISKNLSLDLKELKARTNSTKTDLNLNSPKGESLYVSKDDDFIQSLVGYTSEGGGSIHLKARGIRKLFKTEDKNKSIEIENFEIYSDDETTFINLIEKLKDIFND